MANNVLFDLSALNGSKKFAVTQIFPNPHPDRSDPFPDAFGAEVALDGDKVLIGARFDDTFGNNSGAAYLFDAVSGNLTQTFSYPELDSGDTFGTAVAIDGDKILIGATGEDEGRSDFGTAFLFDANSGNLIQNFFTPDSNVFGSSVAIDEDKVLVGDVQNDTFAAVGGAAFLFDAASGNLTQSFFSPNPEPEDFFGDSVAIDGDKILIGASAGSSRSGSAFLFDANSGHLIQSFSSPNPNPDAEDFFGGSVAINGDKVLISATGDDTFGENSGAAYLFKALSGDLLQTFSPPNPIGSEFFGTDVDINGDKVLIGARGDDTFGEDSGAAFLYDANNGNLIQSLFAPSPNADDGFGFSVAIDGDSLLIGAPGPSEGQRDSGTVYLFEPFKIIEITVDTLLDENDGDLSPGDVSLREAIAFVKDGGTIDFDPSLTSADVGFGFGTIGLTLGELVIDKSLTINGLGADELTVSGNNDSRVFLVDDGSDDSPIEVTIDNLTITDGSADFGAGILNRENLTVTSSVIRNNLATADGSALFNVNSGTVEVSNSTLRNNFAEFRGGGISNGSFDFDIDGGTVRINNSTISNNEADVGGGIFNQENGFLMLTNTTISGNASVGGGAGIDNDGRAELQNTIVAGNEGLNPDVSRIFISNGYNLIGDGTDSIGFNAPGDQVGTSENPIDPKLGSLQDNGGPTFTQALLSDSPAIDAGDPNFEQPPEFDQRGPGFPRVLDGDGDGTAILDIGAFEAEGEAEGEVNKAVLSGTGDITGIVEAFRGVVGADGDNNGNEIGSQGEGFREINWDGGAVPFNMPGNFFNNQNSPVNGLPRGVELSTASDVSLFGVSNPVLPADPFFGDNEFNTINSTYSEQFTTFSSPRLFAPLDLNFMDVDFFEPGVFDENGEPVPALVTGFGAIFTDVDLPERTKLEFFASDGDLLFSQFVEPEPQGLSFLGVAFEQPVVSKVRITSGNVPLSFGLDDDPFGTGVDVVAMDNFIYGEPLVA